MQINPQSGNKCFSSEFVYNPSRSTTAKHSAQKLRHVETAKSASPLEAHIPAVSVELFPENHDIVKQSACQAADGGPRQCSRPSQP